MRRKLIDALLIIMCFVLQCTVFSTLSLAGISPNILLILTVSFSFMRGETEGMLIGFFSGLICDIFFGSLFGFYALLYMFLGYVGGQFHMVFYEDDIKFPLGLVTASDLAFGLLVYVFMFLLRSRLDFGYYAMHVIIPELVYTIIITLIIYRPLWRLNGLMESWEADTTEYSVLSENAADTENQKEEP